MNRRTTRKRQYVIGTFGGSNAAKNLDAILFELQEPKLTNHVGYYISRMHFALKQFRHIPDMQFRFQVMSIFRRDMLAQIAFDAAFENYPKVRSHLSTHITSIWRDDKREVLGMPKGRGAGQGYSDRFLSGKGHEVA